ncbi:MAG: bifunctional salicylyl-CoA 5-hydroxylase/oxidoreductase [Novosphingobium sp.]
MKITVIGGGPGGMYFALLTKKRRPDVDIEIYEQNRADDTFGFGVVFSDETLDEFFAADPASYELIRENFAYWTDMVISERGNRHVIGGNGFAGCSRMTLLQMLQRRCAEEGIPMHFEAMIDAERLEEQFPDSDLIVDASGINSRIRTRFAKEFEVSIEEKRNYFTWLGAETPLDAFTFFFRETEHGMFCAHTYEYEKGRSTWVVETTPECWKAGGFGELSEEENAARLAEVFKEDLGGRPFLINRSLWRNFPKVVCGKWHHRNVVLLGDAKATAHWSIGSGTKLAMECAISLSDAVIEHGTDIEAVFARYENERRVPVEVIQHNAEVSLRWFENMDMHWRKSAKHFAFSCMSRAKSITWDNIKLRDADFLEACEDDFYRRYEKETAIDFSGSRPTPMFTPFRLRDMTIANRVVMSPMAQYCAVDGMPDQWHKAHYGSRAMGGVGLIVTEMTCPSPDARITDGCTGIWNDEQAQAWQELVRFVHLQGDTRIALQIGHAGRKGSTRTPAEGMDQPKSDGNWPIFSASPIPYLEGLSDTPTEIGRAQMDKIRDEFVAATHRADEAGFDMIELHCAHGYLLASFLSPLTNVRTDEYGGSVENRLRYPLEVFRAVREAWPVDKPMSVRLSCSDWAPGGIALDDVVEIATAFKHAGVDIVHCSSGETVKWQKPVWGRMWQTPFAEHVRQYAGIPTIAVGDITQPGQINTIVCDGRADLCALGRPHLNSPFFTRQAAAHYGVKVPHWPVQLASGQYQLYREAEKDNEKEFDLAAKARPNRRHYRRAEGESQAA